MSFDRNRIRMYPSLVNCTTIDLFADWPQDALLEVGERYLSQIELAGDDKVNFIFYINIYKNNTNKKTFPVCYGKRSFPFVFSLFFITCHCV